MGNKKAENTVKPFPNSPETPIGNEILPKGLGNIRMPYPYFIHNGQLWMVAGRNQNEQVVCRHIPIVITNYTDLDGESDYVEIGWKDYGREKRFIVSSSTLGRKSDLLELTKKGLGVNENNYKKVMDFLDKYLIENNPERKDLSKRLGYVKGKFVHPKLMEDVMIVTESPGEEQVLNSIHEKGTLEGWKKEVLDLAKPHPKGLLPIIASFSAILLKDLNIDSFIVDLSGFTSEGKTTALKAASSVWGSVQYMVEWNLTRVGIERVAGFLQNLPVCIDDTRKASSSKIIEDIAYQFSGSKGKLRGDKKGLQKTVTWNTVLISTGENSILSYTEKAGVSSRVIQIQEDPFGKYDYDFLVNFYTGMQNNYGVAGFAFLEKWLNISDENKQELIKVFHKLRKKYAEASNGNEVLARISAYYALIHFTVILLNKMFDFGIDPDPFEQMFLAEEKNNKSLDKPLQLLNDMLTKLDSNRSTIYYDKGFVPNVTNAFVKRGKHIYFTLDFCKLMLEEDNTQIRHQWQKRGYTVTQKNGKDNKLESIDGVKMRGIQINDDILQQLGFDFSQN